MQTSIHIEGMDKLRSMSKAASRIVDTEARKGVKESAQVVRTQAVANARRFSIGNQFPSSIRYKLEGLKATIASQAKTALSIEEGRRPGEIVRFGLILGWIRRKGVFRGTFDIATQRRRLMSKRQVAKRGIDVEERRMAAEIVAQIRARGTKPLPFLLMSAEQKRSEVTRIFNDKVKAAVRKIAGSR